MTGNVIPIDHGHGGQYRRQLLKIGQYAALPPAPAPHSHFRK
jgi:hypothetical protein